MMRSHHDLLIFNVRLANQPSVPLAITSLPVAGQFWVITLLPSSSCNRRRAPRRGVLDYACLGGTYQIVSSISNATYCPISGICLCERRLHAAVCNVACSLRTDKQSSVRPRTQCCSLATNSGIQECNQQIRCAAPWSFSLLYHHEGSLVPFPNPPSSLSLFS